MAVRRGTATPSAIFRGTVPVQKIMRGTVEVWSAKPPVSPTTLGAVHWLPFTPELTTDLGTQPRVWSTNGSMAGEGGALSGGIVQNPANTAYTPVAGCAMTYWVKNTRTINALGASALQATASFSEMSQSINGQTRAVQWTFRRGATTAQNVYAGTVPRGEWTFIAACMEPVSGTTWRYRGYINGTQVVNNTYNAGTQHAVTFASARANSQDGHVDDAAIYNRALTAEEITALYGVGRTS